VATQAGKRNGKSKTGWWIQGRPTTLRKVRKLGQTGPSIALAQSICRCKTKATLLLSKKPTNADIGALDRLPFGARILDRRATSLGMDLIGAPTAAGQPRRSTLEANRWKDVMTKVCSRAGAGMKSRRSHMDSITYWNTYCLPCTSYQASYRKIRFCDAVRLLQVRSRLIKTRRWLPAGLVTGIAKAMQIGNIGDPTDSSALSLIGTALRLHGTDWLVHAGALTERTAAAARLVTDIMRPRCQGKARTLWKKCVTALHEKHSRQLNRNIMKALKQQCMEVQLMKARAYLKDRSLKRRWCPSDGREWDRIGSIPTSAAKSP